MTALNARIQFNMTTGKMQKVSEKLSSGYKINRAADDAAGLSISEKMRRQIRGLTRGSQNVQDGISLTQVADGALNEIHVMIHRISELAVQSANGTNSEKDREALQQEVSQIKKEITRTFNTTDFNGMSLFRCPYVLGVSDNPHPNDIQMFNINTSGNQVTGSGGLIFNSKRYTWGEMGADVVNGIFQSDFETSFIGDDGGDITLKANKGDTVADIERYYQVTSDEEGVYVNNVPAARWPETSASGKWTGADTIIIDDNSYSFTYNGIDVSFTADDGDDRETVIERLNPDPLAEGWSMYFTVKAIPGVTYESAVKSQGGTMILDVKESNKHDIANYTYKLSADEDGVTVLQTNGNDGIAHRKIAWSEFVNVDTGEHFRFSDWGDTDEGSNPQTFDSLATYRYTDNTSTDMETPLSFTFTVKDEASKQGIIAGLNNITLSGGDVSAPLKIQGDADKGAVIIGARKFDFELQRDMLGRTFDDAMSPIEGTIIRTRVDLGTVNTYIKTHTMKELYVNKITEEYDENNQLISTNSEYVSLTNQQASDSYEYTDSVTGHKIREYYENNTGTFSFYYDNGSSKVSAYSYISSGIYGRDDSGATIGNDDEHLGYSEASLGSDGQKYIITSTGSSVDLVFNAFKYVYEYTNPSGEVVLNGEGYIEAGSPDFQENDFHIDSKVGVKDWKGRDVDTSDEKFNGPYVKTYGPPYRYGTAFARDEAWLTQDGSSRMGPSISVSYNNAYDSPDGSGSALSIVHTYIYPTAEATRTFTKYATNRGASYRTDYESISAPPPQKSLNIQSGPNMDDGIELTWDGMSLSTIALGGANVSTENGAVHTLSLTGRAIEIVSQARSRFGAYQNRLEHTMASIDNTAENVQAAESRIRDADLAKEMVEYFKHRTLEQVGESMISQANQSQQGVLNLLQ